MNASHTLVKVVVPVYRDRLEQYERISLEQDWKVLNAYPFVFIRQDGLDISPPPRSRADLSRRNGIPTKNLLIRFSVYTVNVHHVPAQ